MALYRHLALIRHILCKNTVAEGQAARSVSASPACEAIRRGMDEAIRPDEAWEGAEPQIDLVEQFIGQSTMSQQEKNKQRLRETTAEYQRFDGDTGSSEIQVARLTEKIAYMARHMEQHRKDFHSRRGLQAMLTRRRKLLQYMRKSDFDTYSALLLRLRLRDNYAKQDRFTARTSGR